MFQTVENIRKQGVPICRKIQENKVFESAKKMQGNKVFQSVENTRK
jgi:hypothetical protein